jgi:hypothetical protein
MLRQSAANGWSWAVVMPREHIGASTIADMTTRVGERLMIGLSAPRLTDDDVRLFRLDGEQTRDDRHAGAVRAGP